MYKELLYRPYLFQGRKKKNNYFEGWYYKLVSKDAMTEVTFIPGISVGLDGHSFIQVLVSKKQDNQSIKTYHSFGADDFKYTDDPFRISIHHNHFGLDQLDINLVNEDLSIVGKIDIKDITPYQTGFLRPNTMGIFGYVRLLSCHHHFVSLSSNINGVLNIDGEPIEFKDSKLYIEKNWGKSFPKSYVWMQANHFTDRKTAFTFSYANIPLLGLNFRGLVSVLNVKDKQYLFSSYNGSKVKREGLETNQVIYTIKKKNFRIEITAIQNNFITLLSPKRGQMVNEIKEGLSGKIALSLYEDDLLIYSDTSIHAGIEIMKTLKSKHLS